MQLGSNLSPLTTLVFGIVGRMPLYMFTCSLMFFYGLVVSPCVFSAEQPKENKAYALFNSMDANADGMLSPDEHASGAKKMFEMMDVNKNGAVTSGEMDTAHEKVAGHKAANTDLSSAEKIKVVDTNGDGVLTAEEHASGSKKMFDKMDTDRDGFLSKEEWAAGHEKMLQKPKVAH